MYILYGILAIIYIVGGISVVSSKLEKDNERRQKREARQRRYNDRQRDIQGWRVRRQKFEELRLTPEFKLWKEEQYKCQDKKCAWCQKPIQLNSYYTHVDHIKPLYHGGTNDYYNLVLACSYCNRRKGNWTTGWTGEPFEVAKHHTNSKPDWIKENPYSMEFNKKARGILGEVRKKYSDGTSDRFIKPACHIEDSCSVSPKPVPLPNLNTANIEEQDIRNERIKPLPKQNSPATTTSQPKASSIILNTNERVHVNPSSLFRDGHEIGMEYGTAIHANDAEEGENDWDSLKLARHDAQVRVEYNPDLDSPEYASSQYMSYDYDDWADKYGPCAY